MQPSLTAAFTQSEAWDSLSGSAQGVLRGMLELAFRREVGWSVDSTPKEISQWFGRELGLPPARILEGLKELEEGGYVSKGRVGTGNRYVVRAPIEER